MRAALAVDMMSRLTVLFLFMVGCGAVDEAASGPSTSGSSRDGGSSADARSADASSTTPDPIAIDDAGTDPDSILCLTVDDCANGNPCATPRCVIAGEIGRCEYDPVVDGTACNEGTACGGRCVAGVCHANTCEGTDGGMTPTGGEQPPVDTYCNATCPLPREMSPAFPPYVGLAPDDVPATCHNGFQLGGASGGCGVSVYTLRSRRAGGASAITLDVDFATYLAPDGVTVTGIDAAGNSYILMQTCRLQTHDHAGPSTYRPADETIRQFRLNVRPGTTQLTFDFGQVVSPMYMRVVGLCDFDVTPFTHAAWWEAVP